MRRRVLLGLVLLLALLGSLQAEPKPYVASKLRAPFHLLSCQWAHKIAPENQVFFATREEAIRAGHRPCHVCNP